MWSFVYGVILDSFVCVGVILLIFGVVRWVVKRLHLCIEFVGSLKCFWYFVVMGFPRLEYLSESWFKNLQHFSQKKYIHVFRYLSSCLFGIGDRYRMCLLAIWLGLLFFVFFLECLVEWIFFWYSGYSLRLF